MFWVQMQERHQLAYLHSHQWFGFLSRSFTEGTGLSPPFMFSGPATVPYPDQQSKGLDKHWAACEVMFKSSNSKTPMTEDSLHFHV